MFHFHLIALSALTVYTSLTSFFLGVPTLLATYYQAYKTRQEAQLSREGLMYSQNCLEFILDDGTMVNVVPLDTLHTLPNPDDIILLPGAGFGLPSEASGAFRVGRVEHIYTRVETNALLPRQARLAKVVAHISHVVH